VVRGERVEYAKVMRQYREIGNSLFASNDALFPACKRHRRFIIRACAFVRGTTQNGGCCRKVARQFCDFTGAFADKSVGGGPQRLRDPGAGFTSTQRFFTGGLRTFPAAPVGEWALEMLLGQQLASGRRLSFFELYGAGPRYFYYCIARRPVSSLCTAGGMS